MRAASRLGVKGLSMQELAAIYQFASWPETLGNAQDRKEHVGFTILLFGASYLGLRISQPEWGLFWSVYAERPMDVLGIAAKIRELEKGQEMATQKAWVEAMAHEIRWVEDEGGKFGDHGEKSKLDALAGAICLRLGRPDCERERNAAKKCLERLRPLMERAAASLSAEIATECGQ